MNLEVGKIYPAKVINLDQYIKGMKDYETSALYSREECTICTKCEGKVKLIFPHPRTGEKKASIENHVSINEVKICPEYSNKILKPKKGKLLIDWDYACESVGFSPKRREREYKELLNKLREAISQ